MAPPPEEWREINGRWVSDAGMVWGKKSGKPFDPRPCADGYKRAQIDTGKAVGVHVLVCTAFRGPAPSPKHEVDHLNRDRGDNRLCNLRWATQSENNKNRGKSRGYQNSRPVEVNFGDGWVHCRSVLEAVRTFGFNNNGIMKVLQGKWTHHLGAQIRYVSVEVPSDEEWKTVEGVEVSNRNRFRDALGHTFTALPDPVTGYCRTHGFQLHILVCTGWHGTKPFADAVVDHIDRNRSNNRPENLRWVTYAENRANTDSAPRSRVHNQKRVRMTDVTGYQQDFTSIVDAQNETGVSKAAISHVIARKRGKGWTGGFYWETI